MAYRFDDKQKTLYLGAYPEVGLWEARAARDIAREQLARGLAPSTEKKRGKVQTEREAVEQRRTFEAVAREWFGKKRVAWTPGHQRKILSRHRTNKKSKIVHNRPKSVKLC